MKEFYTCWSETNGGCKQTHNDVMECLCCRINDTTPMLLHVEVTHNVGLMEVFESEKLCIFNSFTFPSCAIPDDSPLDEEQTEYIADIIADITSSTP